MNLIRIFCLACFIFCITSCDSNAKNDNVIIVATAADNPPYEFIQDRQIVGMDIDIINAIAKHIGKNTMIKNLDFPGLLASLSAKNVDLVIAGLSVTPERSKEVDFSDTYNSTSIAILYKKQDAFAKKKDLEGKIVGAQLGSVWASVAKELSLNGHIKTHFLANNLMLVEELKSGAIDAVVLEEMQALKFIDNNEGLASFTLEEAFSDFAIAFPQGSNLKGEINSAIKELQDNGTIDNIRKKWLEIR